MKKRKLLPLIAALSAAIITVCSSSFLSSGSKYNDAAYRNYTNLSQNSDIPSLFKNNSVYASYKKYPPVISDGVEYVPLELFYGLSGIKISFSDDGSNFYVQNKKSNKYISFSINDNYAVTNQNKVYETKTPVFYDIRYVPLKIVCAGAGIGCDTYNDSINEIYAIKVYTNQGLSAKELVEIHAPEIYSPASSDNTAAEKKENDSTNASGNNSNSQENVNSPSDNTGSIQQGNAGSEMNSGTVLNPKPDVNTQDNSSQNGNKTEENVQNDPGKDKKPPSDNTEKTPALPSEGKLTEKEFPTKPENNKGKNEVVKDTFKDGTIMLFYGPENFENVRSTLYTLSGQGVKSTFFVTEDDILNYPDVIREIYILGHTVGITFTESAEQLYAPGALEEKAISAENALYEVTKTKTRIVSLPMPPEGMRAQADSRIAALGLCNVDFNGDTGALSLDDAAAVKIMREKLRNIPEWFGSDTAYIKTGHTSAGNAVVGVIADAARAHSNLKLALFDETTK